MTATANPSRARRKPPEKRRDEIAAAAGRIAIANGLAQLTAKRVADSVGVYPGLVNHYFRSSDDLAAAGFASATERRREQQAAMIAETAGSPSAELRAFLHDALSPEHDAAALLWLDAWRESPRRPALQREVIRQMETDLTELTDVLTRGVAAGEFTTDDCGATAMRILAMIDGTFAQSAVRALVAGTALLNYPVVAEMLLRATEQDLGLEIGALD
ncbi:TetR/AcrR family transcriptional regulator [Mycolicibacterium sp. P9-22]|jgi:AcrR family transcriptional regulator|uniref:TetR/AcrR family transcriptional regulator n=1 Tax=Mycolicibacterium sp. P9-22 TaxID=2024613 RepID=UPI0011EF3C20|nr:TetR/AcrR family transcriptional regulator [Mycolicibacterium sp. P9-22]KAA0120110.1 TetR family transcriptional regulator [Mycolicibacterium sp. P9-22]MDF2826255.1 betI 10 [Mycobacterium sp.]